MKLCPDCNIEKDESEFNKNKDKKDGLQTHCIPCHRQRNRGSYKKYRQKGIDRARKNAKKRAEWFRNYKKTLKCLKCSENHPACLHFHHRNGKDKINNIGHMIGSNSISYVLKEIAKCDVLCANCHAKHHYEEKHGSLV